MTQSAVADSDSACPERMRLIDMSFCPEVKRICLDDEYSSSNKITICHRFKEEPARCLAQERKLRFCIDEYEYPNERGARSPVMVDFYDAMALCNERGKRLCWEGEWTAACEGSTKTPFPYGYVRSKETCNIENTWIRPSLDKMYDKDPAISGPELLRLDQGVASGSRPNCKSDFGVHDQTGNVDEWVMLEKKRGKGGWAGLKGGAWGHVRNACRPVTTSHAPEFTYYFVSFRCCADAKGEASERWAPPPLPANPKSPKSAYRGFTPR
jgi:formylglycine-generating enzyme